MLSADFWKLFGPIIAGAYGLFGIALLTWLLKPGRGDSHQSVTFLAWLRAGYRRLTNYRPQRSSDDSKPGQDPGNGDPTQDSETAKASREYFAFPLLACMVFALGVVLDSAVDDFVDASPMAGRVLIYPVALLLPEETELRFTALFEWRTDCNGDPDCRPGTCDESLVQASGPWRFARHNVVFRCKADYAHAIRSTVKSGECRLHPSGLGRELLDEPRLYAHFLESRLRDGLACRAARSSGGNPSDCTDWILDFVRDPDAIFQSSAAKDDQIWGEMCREAEKLARKLYYDASNWAVRDESVSVELGRWVSQVALLGSTSIVATYSLVALLFAAVVGVILDVWRRGLDCPRLLHPRRMSMLAWATVSFLVAWLSAYGYTIAQRNAIERTLGMYVSAAHSDADLEWPAGTAAIRRLCAHEGGREVLSWCKRNYLKSLGIDPD